MAELEDKLNQILSNPDSMKKVMDLASGLMSAQKAGGSRSAEPQAPCPEGGGRDLGALLGSMAPGGGQSPPASGGGGLDLSSLLASLAGKRETGQASGGDPPSAEEVPAPGGFDIAALPRLMQAFSGETNYLKQEKVNLLRALKPYLGQRRAPEIDRAVKMANLARAAQDTLGGFLRR